MELTLILIQASLPARAASYSRRMRWIRPVRTVRGATSKTVEAGLRRVTGELVEQTSQILADHRVAGQQTQIGVQSRGLRVVVTGAYVAVAA